MKNDAIYKFIFVSYGIGIHNQLFIMFLNRPSVTDTDSPYMSLNIEYCNYFEKYFGFQLKLTEHPAISGFTTFHKMNTFGCFTLN